MTTLFTKISEGPSRPQVSCQATPAGFATHRLRTAGLQRNIISFLAASLSVKLFIHQPSSNN